ncbi:MAG: AmmeMemoRadiSam system protein B [Balneolales bacterium]|nr:AmmeMemoRadiSam system protein B [Balneolales bacterium]
MDYQKYSIEQILEEISASAEQLPNRARLIFAQEHLNESSFKTLSRLYSYLRDTHYDDVIIIENYRGKHDKYLPMVSVSSFETPTGNVTVNDMLRNDFCDEDDDFYIDDAGLSEEMCVYSQLTMLNAVMKDYRAISIQITENRPSIVRELASAVSELLRERNALIIICTDVNQSDSERITQIQKMVDEGEISRLMNYIFTGDAGIRGAGALAAGVLIAKEWELKTRLFMPDEASEPQLIGYSCLHSVVAAT